MSGLRSGISSAFAGTTFSTTNVLGSSYLSTIDVLVITSVGAQGGGPNVVLSAAEQAALVAFINSGGGALLITDNGGFNAGNVSLVAPFGMVPTDPTGPSLANRSVTIVNSSHPVTSGAFGIVTNYDVDFTGAYDSLGPNAIGLARVSDPGNAAIDNKFVLAAISPGVQSPTSGGVVFVSDLNFLIDGQITGNVQNLVNNAVRFATQPAVPGASQHVPLLPDSVSPDGTFVFTNVPSGSWVDPPLVSGFHYEMTSPGSLFTGISGFPTGFSSPFTVSVGANILGQFSPGQSLTFPGGGVSSFDISGINPLADAANPLAFPLQLTFSTATASFTMQGVASTAAVPEPATFLAWSTFALLGLVARARVAIGDRVRITRGALAGLLGRILAFTESRRCVLAIDGIPDGVQIVISGDSLEVSSAANLAGGQGGK